MKNSNHANKVLHWMQIPLTIPNILSLFRIFAAPFLLLSGWLDIPVLFFVIFGLMLLSDALDGILARAWHQTSDIGAKLDSYGDIMTYLTTPVAAWWLWPDLMNSEKSYIIGAIVIYVFPAIVAFVKFHQLVSYHTWITKISAVFMCVGLIVLFVLQDPILFHIAIGVLCIEAIENIAITLILKQPKSNVRSFWHVYKGNL